VAAIAAIIVTTGSTARTAGAGARTAATAIADRVTGAIVIATGIGIATAIGTATAIATTSAATARTGPAAPTTGTRGSARGSASRTLSVRLRHSRPSAKMRRVPRETRSVVAAAGAAEAAAAVRVRMVSARGIRSR
jgi:hypothetical protein